MNKYLSTIMHWRPRIFKILSLILTVSLIAVVTFFLFVYVESFYKNREIKKDVLGTQINAAAIDRATLETSLHYWQQIIITHPDYEDAYVQLTMLSYQLEDSESVKRYIDALRARNPNHALLEKLSTLIENNVKE